MIRFILWIPLLLMLTTLPAARDRLEEYVATGDGNLTEIFKSLIEEHSFF